MRSRMSPSGALRRSGLTLLAAAAACVLLSSVASAQRGTGTLAGVVLGPGDVPVAGARVIVQAADGSRPRALRASSSGRFRLQGLRAGLYELRAQHEGMWSEWRHNILVRAGRETNVVLRLLPGEPPAEPVPLRLAGHVREWEIPLANSRVHDPATDPAGNVWLTLMCANQIARLNPLTGEWKFFTTPTAHSGPHGLVSDDAGNIWYTANSASKIGRVDAVRDEITEYKTPF